MTERFKKIEREPAVSSKVVLEFMRHGKKEVDPSKANEDILLSDEGKRGARERGRNFRPEAGVAVVYGGPKERTRETAGHILLSDAQDISPTASLQEMEDYIAKEQKVGKKIIEDDRLNFDNSGPIGGHLQAAFKANNYLPVLVADSDRMALELSDQTSTTYLRHAGNIAELVSRYSKVGNNFNRLVGTKDSFKAFGNQLERCLATHQGVAESFLAKVLEEEEGVASRDEFIRSVGGGFDELQGIRVEIENKGADQSITVYYHIGEGDRSITLNADLLDKIIQERQEFEEKFGSGN